MRGYVRRVSQKAEKLSKEQLLSLIDDFVDENENLYSILESLSTGLVIVDNDFVPQQNNTTAESILPLLYHFEDSRASSLTLWELVDDDDIAAFLKNVWEKGITNSTEEFTTMTHGGTVRFIQITISPLIYKNEQKGTIILVRDITERKNQDVLLHRMENMANLTNLAAGMAHEIKNPLGAISIHIQLIQKALEKARNNNDILPPKKFVEDHIDVVNEEVDHLNKLIMDFLLAVRPVNATLELKNPAKLISGMIEFVEPEFQKEKIDVVFSTDDKNARIMLDEKLLRQIIMNLSQNALAAIKARKEKETDEYNGEFKIECLVKEHKYILLVSDNGTGMSNETAAKIFEPYYTTKATGTGLGMTMVYKIIKEFSGEILIDSALGKGTVFKMVFPIPQKDKKLIAQAGE